MDSPRVVYVPRHDATVEGEQAVLAAAYRLIIDCAKKEGCLATTPENAEERIKDDFRATEIIPE